MIKNLPLILFFLAITIRFSYVFFYPQQSIKGDSFIYVSLAKNIKAGQGLVIDKGPGLVSDMQHYSRGMPGYPIILGMIFKYISENYLIIRMMQAVISALTCLLIFLWGQRMYGQKVGIAAMFVAALYPPFISYSGLLLNETIIIFIATCFYCYLAWILTHTRPRSILLESIVFGFCMVAGLYIRSDFCIFIIPIIIVDLFSHNIHRAIKQFCLVLVLICLGLTPWIMRNYKTFGEPLLLSRDAAIAFWMGSIPSGFTQWDTETPQERNEYNLAQVRNKPITTSKNLVKLAVHHIRDNPLYWSESVFKRIFKFWIGSHSNSISGLEPSLTQAVKNHQWFVAVTKCLLLFSNTLIVILGVLLFLLDRKNIIIMSPFLFLLIAKTILNSTTVASPRYHLILMPFLIVFACRSFQLIRAYHEK